MIIDSRLSRYGFASLASALLLTLGASAFAESGTDSSSSADAAVDCNTRMAEIEDLIREKDMEIPSGALNDIFTLQQQASEACAGGNDEMAMGLLDDLEETILAAVEEGIPTVTADDVEAEMEAELESTGSGSTIVDSMNGPDAGAGGGGESGFPGEETAEESGDEDPETDEED
ncbi:hypothetical protein [Fodinicurvata sp. EGI_FJ10296]|uniref:hypothetical protein n=1 Tax=Fodinicurvata sp. EGI_FJ10296 TaxID=3231908 RepID=UPI0034554010